MKQNTCCFQQAILAGATGQLRNLASVGGNLWQETRRVYYRKTAYGCNKRQPCSGCSAIGGSNCMLAILGISNACIATNPSDQMSRPSPRSSMVQSRRRRMFKGDFSKHSLTHALAQATARA